MTFEEARGQLISALHLTAGVLDCKTVAGKLADYARSGTTTLSVNMPTVALHGGSVARFSLLHRNVPGVLARADSLVGEHGLNVDGQVLATRGELG